jgi:hypothetical protein
MDEIVNVFLCWQFLLVAGIVFLIFGFFNGLRGWKGIGHYLWAVSWRKELRCLRKFLKIIEAIKVPLLAVIGFGLGWIPGMPRPDELSDSSTLSVALLYAVAGICSMFLVKSIKKVLEARGIDIDIDIPPKNQNLKRRLR